MKQLQIQQDGDGWLHRTTTPAIYQAYKEFMETGAHPYTANVVDWIADKYDVADSDKEQLGHEVYVAADMFRLEQKTELEKELKAKGFTPITEFELKEGQHIILQGRDKPLRVHQSAVDNSWFGFPPHHSRTGTNLSFKIYEHTAYEKAKQDGRTHMAGEAVVMVKEA